MKHRSSKKILSRKINQRTALIKSLASSLIYYESIETTEAKARAMKPRVEKLITIGKKNNLFARRQLLNFLQEETAVKKILEVLSPRYQSRNGGYLKIIKLAKTRIDGARLAIIKFI